MKKHVKPIYVSLKSIWGSLCLKYYISRNQNLRIIIGASKISWKGWFPAEQEFLDLTKAQDFKRFFDQRPVSVFLSEHVFEHLTPQQALIGFQNCFNYLKKGGYFRIAVPDGFHPSSEYINSVKPHGKGLGADDHKVLYNYQSLSALLQQAGFDVRLLEYFDEQGEFHCKEWLPEDGMIRRSARFDTRNQNGQLNYTSLIVDAYKI
jgi:predicted SAM-dependent methyltransferase